MINNIKRRINIGDVIETWCSTCGHKTEHVFGAWKRHWLTCLVCEPDAKEIVKEEKNG